MAMIAFQIFVVPKGPQSLICLRSIVAWDITITSPFDSGKPV